MSKEIEVIEIIHKDETRSDQSTSQGAAWIRLNAFLSTRSPNTVITYKGVLQEWLHFLGKAVNTSEGELRMLGATDLHAISYRQWLQNQPGIKPRYKKSVFPAKKTKALSTHIESENQKKTGLDSSQTNSTIWKKMAILRKLYKVLIGTGIFKNINPFDSELVPPPAKEAGKKRPTEMVNFINVKEVLNLPNATSKKGQRDRAILAALFGGGLRRSEVASLTLGDVKKTQKGTTYLYLRATKGKKDSEQTIPDWAADAIYKVKEEREKEGALSGDFLFVSYRGQGAKSITNEAISHSGIYKLFKQYCMLAGVNNVVSPHSARATAITKLLDDGVSHREVQEFSRHSSVQMVEVYDKRRIGVENNPGKKLEY